MVEESTKKLLEASIGKAISLAGLCNSHGARNVAILRTVDEFCGVSERDKPWDHSDFSKDITLRVHYSLVMIHRNS